jgi:hypothetical protein
MSTNYSRKIKVGPQPRNENIIRILKSGFNQPGILFGKNHRSSEFDDEGPKARKEIRVQQCDWLKFQTYETDLKK